MAESDQPAGVAVDRGVRRPVSNHGDMRAPWLRGPLVDWAIVGMNHYRMHGQKRLFVAMTNGEGLCIQEEGADDEYLWNRLCHKAWAVADNKTPNVRSNAGPTAPQEQP